jgi:hypothetical protein
MINTFQTALESLLEAVARQAQIITEPLGQRTRSNGCDEANR